MPHLPGDRIFVHLYTSAASLLRSKESSLEGIKACRLCGAVKRADGVVPRCPGKALVTTRAMLEMQGRISRFGEEQERSYGTVQLGR